MRTRDGVIARESGRSSIPEAAVIESRGCGVLDAPVKPGHDRGVRGYTARASYAYMNSMLFDPIGSSHFII
jgi:hypothetical protein